MAKLEKDTTEAPGRVLGDINPTIPARPRSRAEGSDEAEAEDDNSAMSGGSQHERTKHSGSRDVSEGTSGGLGPETGGTRNYRQGSGATGGDIGNRPE
jgi:hypothetical protein